MNDHDLIQLFTSRFDSQDRRIDSGFEEQARRFDRVEDQQRDLATRMTHLETVKMERETKATQRDANQKYRITTLITLLGLIVALLGYLAVVVHHPTPAQAHAGNRISQASR